MSYRISYLTLLLCGVILNACTGQPKSKITKPNIIYILADDLGYGDIGCYGQKILKTPHIDQMAAEGIRFTQHYAGSSVCAPSRASLMTGRDMGHSRVRGNYETGPYGFGGELELRPQDLTIAELEKNVGYKTALFGKWGLGMDGSTGEPNKKGFDESYGYLNQAHAHEHFPQYLFRNGKKVDVKENAGGKKNYFSNDIFTDETVNYIKAQKNGDKPFFIYLAYITPHAEMVVPEDSIFNSYKGKFDEVPFIKGKEGSNGTHPLGAYSSQPYPKAAFATMITRIDLDVQRVLDALKQQGLDENTIVIFSSDNGPHKEGGQDPYYFKSNGSFRGIKRDLYEGGIRVPFIVRWPNKIKAGIVSDHVSAFWDMLPTFAEISGADMGQHKTEGISLLPTLMGHPEKQKNHDALYWEFHENKTSHQAVRMGDWKGIRHSPKGSIELFNLKTDPSETDNVAIDNPEKVLEIEKFLNNYRVENSYFPLKY